MAEPSLIAKGSEIASFALKSRLPAVYPFPEHARAGGLLTYATSYYDLLQRGVFCAELKDVQRDKDWSRRNYAAIGLAD